MKETKYLFLKSFTENLIIPYIIKIIIMKSKIILLSFILLFTYKILGIGDLN